jgi:Predicted chitinase
MNRAAFFASVRSRTSGIFGTSLSRAQVEGCEAILDEGQKRGMQLEQLAYVLATAFHETAHTMQPVRETLAKSDSAAITALDRAYAAGKLSWVSKPYWRKDADGKAWFGRGLVQITHKDNYAKFDLSDDPSKALEMPTAIRVLFDGMEKGMFTGKKLAQYITPLAVDYVGARRIVNGTDKAKQIAGYALAFEKALREAKYLAVAPQPRPTIPPEPAKPAPPVVIDKANGKTDWLANLLNAIIAILKGGKK